MGKILLLRHGATKGNLEKRYISSTDEPLLPESILRIKEQAPCLRNYFGADAAGLTVYISPMRRCRETAELVFPGQVLTTVEHFRECDFGAFEYMNYAELNGNPDYQRFVDSGGESGFPGGESKKAFSERVCRAFEKLHLDGDIALVVHGGTIMAILDRFSDPHGDYYSWQVPCGSGFIGEWNGVSVSDIRRWDGEAKDNHDGQYFLQKSSARSYSTSSGCGFR